MAKKKSNSQKRKRNKSYTGEDAAVTGKTVQRISVPDRSKTAQWWHENRKKIGLRVIFFGAIFLVLWLFYVLLSWIF